MASASSMTGVKGTPAKCDEYDSLIQEKLKLAIDMTTIADPEKAGWKKGTANKDVALFLLPGAEHKVSTDFAMSRGTIDACPRAILDLMMTESPTTKALMDDMHKKNKVLATYNNNVIVSYDLWKSIPLLLSARDSLTCTTFQVQDDGSIVLLSFSLPEFPGCPKEGSVRIKLFIDAWLLTPLEGNRCQATNVNNTDMGLSSSNHKKMNDEMPGQIVEMRAILGKRDMKHYSEGGERAEPLTNTSDIIFPEELETKLFGK